MELLGHEAYNLPEPREGESPAPAPDPDAGKHAFEVFCDCIALDEQLVAYLIDVLKRQDRTAFYKLSQVTTHLDLNPREFLYWLSHREDYGSTDERACALIMDACFTRLYEEQQGELLGALLSGDRQTFELFRTEAPRAAPSSRRNLRMVQPQLSRPRLSAAVYFTMQRRCISRHAGGGEMNRDEMYLSLGVSEKVLAFGEAVLEELKPRFAEIEQIAELNQVKVIAAMQENRVNATHFAASTGYGLR